MSLPDCFFLVSTGDSQEPQDEQPLAHPPAGVPMTAASLGE
ncbi:hypothetical protein [Undibacterium sp. Jales W-56]|nr:hypothetical protein [Undibacterium sp. Jales W-56]